MAHGSETMHQQSAASAQNLLHPTCMSAEWQMDKNAGASAQNLQHPTCMSAEWQMDKNDRTSPSCGVRGTLGRGLPEKLGF